MTIVLIRIPIIEKKSFFISFSCDLKPKCFRLRYVVLCYISKLFKKEDINVYIVYLYECMIMIVEVH